MTRPTLARREPLTVGSSAPLFTAVAAGLALAAAAAGATSGVTLWPAEAAALALLLGAGAVLVVGAGPFRAPFRARTHGIVLLLLLLGLVLDLVARAGTAPLLPGADVLVVVLLFQLGLALLRPPLHVLVGGAGLAAGVTGAVLALPGPSGLTAARAVAAGAAVLIPSVAAAAFGRVALHRLRPGPDRDPDQAPADAVRLSVQQEAIARLEAEAVPLIERVTAGRALTRTDAARAAAIADGLRAALLADLARGWLVDAGVAADDPGGYAERMSPQQRTAIRTAFEVLPLADPAHPGSALVTGQDRDVELVLHLPLSGTPERRRVAPLVPLLRAAFATAEVRVDPGGTAVLVVSYGIP